MELQTFEQSLRHYLRRKPFVPFVVALLDGRRITVDQPRVAINGRGAGFLSRAEGLVDFSCDEVHHFEDLGVTTVLRTEGNSSMTREDFERDFKAYLHRKPFLPFAVALTDGRQYVIDHPSITFDGGVVGFMSESDGLIDFSFDEVDHFGPLVPEPQT